MNMKPDPDTTCGSCCFILRNIFFFILSHIGLVSLVIGYCIAGAATFEHLEKGYEEQLKKNMTAERKEMTFKLWNITNHVDLLKKDNWTSEVVTSLKKFEEHIVEAIKKKGWNGKEGHEEKDRQWTFTSALFYSIIVITTIGYGHIAPRTDEGKIVTIFYAILGIPLMLLCLSNIGDAMAHSFRFLYWKVCCYLCIRKPKKKKRQQRPYMSRHTSSYRSSPREDGYNDSEPNSPTTKSVRQLSTRTRPSSLRHSKRSADSNTPSGSEAEDYERTYNYEDQREMEEYSRSRTLSANRRHQPDRSLAPPTRSYRSSAEPPDPKRVLCNKYALDAGDLKVIVPPESREAITSESEVLGRREQNKMSRYSRPGSKSSRLVMAEDEFEYDSEFGMYDSDYDEEHEIRPVPIWLCVFLVVAYIFGGAFLFKSWEEWNYLDSAYFCFITLTTIGFGDFVPAQSIDDEDKLKKSVVLCSVYLLFGIALLAMSFNLVQEEVIAFVKGVAKSLGILKEEEYEEE